MSTSASKTGIIMVGIASSSSEDAWELCSSVFPGAHQAGAAPHGADAPRLSHPSISGTIAIQQFQVALAATVARQANPAVAEREVSPVFYMTAMMMFPCSSGIDIRGSIVYQSAAADSNH